MPDPTTPLIQLNVPTTGTDVGTWGLSLNANFDVIDGLTGGITQISIVGGTVTLAPTQLPFGTIQFIGSLTSDAIIVVPAWAGYLTVLNSTTGAHALTVVLSGQPRAVVVPQGTLVNMFFSPTGPETTANFPSGTVMVFVQPAAPTGWIQLTGINDAALRIVNTSSGGTGAGTVGLSAFIAAGDNPVALSLTQIPVHTHVVTDPGHQHGSAAPNNSTNVMQPGGTAVWAASNNGVLATSKVTTGISIQNAGSGGTHAHGFPDLQYFDALIASKV